jgi:hypothetical protein
VSRFWSKAFLNKYLVGMTMIDAVNQINRQAEFAYLTVETEIIDLDDILPQSIVVTQLFFWFYDSERTFGDQSREYLQFVENLKLE